MWRWLCLLLMLAVVADPAAATTAAGTCTTGIMNRRVVDNVMVMRGATTAIWRERVRGRCYYDTASRGLGWRRGTILVHDYVIRGWRKVAVRMPAHS